MTNNEIKILSNMALLLSKIEIKESYTEEEYSNIFQLIDGYHNLEKYFENKDIINEILDKKIRNYKLVDLLRVVRNRVSHIDKNNCVNQLLLLQTEVDKKDVNKVINEIKIEMDEIFKRDLNNDAYKLVMNTRMMSNIFATINYSLYTKEPKNEFDKYCREELGKIIEGFNYEDSTFEDLEIVNNKIIEFYKTDKVKNGTIVLYGEDSYKDLLRMMTDDAFKESEIIELMTKIKNSEVSNDEI